MDSGDKHGPRVDERLHTETEAIERSGRQAHTEEWRQPEPAGEGQPDVDRAPDATLVGGTPPGMGPADVNARNELARYLRRSEFPATRATLLATATEEQAPDAVLETLRSLPAESSFQNVQEVWARLGGGVESHRV